MGRCSEALVRLLALIPRTGTVIIFPLNMPASQVGLDNGAEVACERYGVRL